MRQRYPPSDPREWLNRARSNLVVARMDAEGVYLEDLCFNAQQAVEKAVKGVLIKFNVEFPYTHNIAELLTLVRRQIHPLPDFLVQSADLSGYAAATRYPHLLPSIAQRDYEEAVRIAEQVLRWAEGIILGEMKE